MNLLVEMLINYGFIKMKCGSVVMNYQMMILNEYCEYKP